MTNIDLLTTTNDHIRKFPELHNQAAFAEGLALPSDPVIASLTGVPWEATEADLRAGDVCGTAMCFAGWASLLGGWHQCLDLEDYVVDETGRTLHMADAAMESLGLTGNQASMLFGGCNSLELIDRFVAALVADPGITPAQMVMIKLHYLNGR